jgi:predicted dehydrogenase
VTFDAVLFGAGQRGREIMGAFARENPSLLRFVAVAEPDTAKRERFAREHAIAPGLVFDSYEPLLARERIAPLCFNTTLDQTHLRSALGALERGYHLFLEKPMATSAHDCLAIAGTAGRLGRLVQICHPLRHTPFYLKVKEVLDSGLIGRPISIAMQENVGHWHFAHSYVRGNWGKHETSGPLILTKCCHDMDIAAWLVGAPARRVAAVGSRTHFRTESAPPGATERCTDGCPAEKTCPHWAPGIYLTDDVNWPTSVISVDTSLEARRRALETGPYGRCVFRTDNTTIDHMIVAIEFEDGTSLDFTVRGTTADCFRTIRVLGSKGELNGHIERNDLRATLFRQGKGETQATEDVAVPKPEGTHLGGDPGAIRNFLRCVAAGDHDAMRASLAIAVEGHLLAFAAEAARLQARTVDMADYRKECAQ